MTSSARFAGRWTTDASVRAIAEADSFSWTGRQGVGYAMHSSPRGLMIAKATHHRVWGGYSLRLPGWLWTVTDDGAFPSMLLQSNIKETPVRAFKTLRECKSAVAAIVGSVRATARKAG
jgi:hypothetical protein